MAAKRGKKGRRKGHHTAISRGKAGARRSKADISRSRGHKPVALLEKFLAGMPARERKLRATIAKRKAAGE